MYVCISICIDKYKMNCKYAYPRRTPEKCKTENKKVCLKIFLNIYFFFYYLFEYLSAFVYMNHVLDESPQRLEDSVRFPGIGVAHDCELPCRCLEYNPHPLQVPLTPEPLSSLQFGNYFKNLYVSVRRVWSMDLDLQSN